MQTNSQSNTTQLRQILIHACQQGQSLLAISVCGFVQELARQLCCLVEKEKEGDRRIIFYVKWTKFLEKRRDMSGELLVDENVQGLG